MLRRKNLILITFLVILSCSIIFYSGITFADEKENRKEDVKLTTCNINKPYKIIDLVVYRMGHPDLNKVNEKLKEQARSLNADYVIGVRYVTYAGYLFGYGTAVKTK